MVVDGAVVMVENIVRHLGRHDNEPKTPIDRIRQAAHEVQRPVFYAIGIIITAYLPILRCSVWKADCSNLWLGRWRSLCLAR
jgi:Cu/Ag efflux pump CusA